MNSSTRAACDRCHGQKMKCIRNSGAQAKCNRCEAARAECTFSPPRKSGRPPASKELSPPMGWVRDGLGTNQCGSRQVNWSQTQIRHNSSASQDSGFVSPAHTIGPEIAPSAEGFDTVILDHGDSSFLSFLHSPGANVLPFEHLGEEPFAVDDGPQSHSGFSANLSEYALLDKPRDRYSSGVLDEQAFGTSSTAEIRGASESTSAQGTMRQLSELSGKLFTQVDFHSRLGIPGDLDSGISSTNALERLTSDVLESSTVFLSLLKSFHKPRGSPTEGTNSVAPGFFSDGLTMSNKLNSTSSTNITSCPNLVPDTATTLQLLTAYIRLMQLHHTLYRHIHSLLAATNCSVPAVFPNLTIGETPLAPYPHFQIKFLLQICVHHLGEIEALLGLPPGYRVSEIDRDNHVQDISGGILGQGTDCKVLVRTVMMEIEKPVKDVRAILDRLRVELRGSIQI